MILGAKKRRAVWALESVKNGPADRPSAREIFCLHEYILVASRSYKVTRMARPRIKATGQHAATYEHPAIG